MDPAKGGGSGEGLCCRDDEKEVDIFVMLQTRENDHTELWGVASKKESNRTLDRARKPYRGTGTRKTDYKKDAEELTAPTYALNLSKGSEVSFALITEWGGKAPT